MSERKHWAIVPAAGLGTRMQAERPKQYLSLLGRTILEHSLDAIVSSSLFEAVVVPLSDTDSWWPNTLFATHPDIIRVPGGAERAASVLNALLALQDQAQADDWIWVHDAARPCLSPDEIKALHSALAQGAHGLVLALPIADSVKRCDAAGKNAQNVDRTGLWRALTPQVFPYRLLLDALRHCQQHNITPTDEASAVEALGYAADLVTGSADNIKITVPTDLMKAEQIMQSRNPSSCSSSYTSGAGLPRIGSGFDVHAFGPGSHIVLGGVSIAHTHGLIAHSDGDVLLHALADALLGALALGDIGKHFPDTDAKWAGADSRGLLRAVYRLVQDKGYRLSNADMTIIAQAPKMAPHIATMQANIADDLLTTVDQIGIKATTTEQLGFTGRKEGIACQATVLVVPHV